MSDSPYGFIGLGNMGGPIAANLARNGTALVVHDAAGTQGRAPEGARIPGSNAGVAREAPTVLLCLPDGAIVHAVIGEMLRAEGRRLERVVDTSTIGIEAARAAHALCAEAGVEYVDSPISGGVSGARNATLAVMVAGARETFEVLVPIYERFAKNVFHVGLEPGQGQALKILNNFLSGTSMAATSEAIAFGVGQGLDMKTVIDVLNASSGQNTATLDKFPNRILTGTYDAGFFTRLFMKDLRLYREAVEAAGAPAPVSPAIADLWERFIAASDPGGDFTRIYPFVRDGMPD